MKKPGARVLYLGAASGTTVSHVSDVVGPVSIIQNCIILDLWNRRADQSVLCCSLCIYRLELSMQQSFPIEVVVTWSIWQRSELMLYPLLKMLDIQLSTGCQLEWLMSYFLTLLSLIRCGLNFLHHASSDLFQLVFTANICQCSITLMYLNQLCHMIIVYLILIHLLFCLVVKQCPAIYLHCMGAFYMLLWFLHKESLKSQFRVHLWCFLCFSTLYFTVFNIIFLLDYSHLNLNNMCI